MNKFILLYFLVLMSFISKGQEVSYDTTYQVSYDNGIKDSVIIITKKVMMKEMIYVVDSTVKKNWAVDFYLVPFNKAITFPNHTFGSQEQVILNGLKSQTGQSVGSALYYKKNNWEWRGGIQFSRYKTKVKSKSTIHGTEEQSYFINDTLDSYYSVDGLDTVQYYVIEPKEETITVNTINIQDKETKFTSYYFEVILQGGYRKNWNKFNFYFFAGPIVGFLIYSKGEIINSAGNRVDVNSENHTACIVSAQVNLQLAYDINDKKQFFIEPYFQKYLLTPTTNSAWMKKSDLVGARLGLKLFL